MVVGHKLESAALRKDGRVIVDGAVFEGEGGPRSDLFSMDDHRAVSRSDNVAIRVEQFEIAVDGSLDMSDLSVFSPSIETAGAGQQDDRCAVAKAWGKEIFHGVCFRIVGCKETGKCLPRSLVEGDRCGSQAPGSGVVADHPWNLQRFDICIYGVHHLYIREDQICL